MNLSGTVKPQEVLQYYRARSDQLVDLLGGLVRIDTPSGDHEASAAFAKAYRELLEARGVSCREYDSPIGVHLAGDWPAGGKNAYPDVAVVVHSDTVWPRGEVRRRPPEVREGRFYGPGVFDMRAGLTLALALFEFLETVRPATERRFRIFLSADEERGSVEARKFLFDEVPPPVIALVPEPPRPDGGLKTRRKGVGIYTVTLTGRAAHAGIDPERGASAVDETAREILELHELRDEARGVLINVGEVSGGSSSNVIAEHATFSIDSRFVHAADGVRVDREIFSRKPADRRVRREVSGGILFPPLEPNERSEALVRRAVEIAGTIGMDLGSGDSGGGSDGSLLADRGNPVLDGLGVDGDGAHSTDEYIIMDRLAVRAALLTLLALEL